MGKGNENKMLFELLMKKETSGFKSTQLFLK